jgi:hypothetical protein
MTSGCVSSRSANESRRDAFQPRANWKVGPMSMPVIRRDVGQILTRTIEVADAEIVLTDGADLDKAHAAGRLAMLYRHREALQRRLVEIDQHPEARETIFQWIKEEVFCLSLGVERWMADG